MALLLRIFQLITVACYNYENLTSLFCYESSAVFITTGTSENGRRLASIEQTFSLDNAKQYFLSLYVK